MAPVFFQFKKNNKIDSFLEIFENNGWILPESFSNTLTKYEWPDIVLSKAIRDGQFSMDLLGQYRYVGNNEGQVILFYESIMHAAKGYYNTNPLGCNEKTLNSYFEDLSKVVLIHEFVHWLMHHIDCLEIDPYGTGVRSSCYGSGFINNTPDSLNFHEGLAELFTYLFIKDNKSLLDIFVWVNNQSPAQYQCYKDLVDNGLDNIDLAAIYLNFYKINGIDQSYDKFMDGLSKTPKVFSSSLLDVALLHQVLSIPDLTNCKEFIQACFQKRGSSCFIYLDEDLKKDKNFIYSLLEIYAEVDNDEIPWLQYLPDDLKMDKEFILKTITSSNGNVSVMKWMNKTLLSDENFVLDCVERTTFTNGFIFFYAPEKLCDKDFMLKVIKRNPRELLDACDLLKRDSDILNIIKVLISSDESLVNIFVTDYIIQTHLGLIAIEKEESCGLTEVTEDYFEKFKSTNSILYTTFKSEINKVFTYL
jgi:hypothetical protein